MLRSWQQLQGAAPVSCWTRWRLVELGAIAGSGGTASGGGGRSTHSTSWAMCTPRMMMLGVCLLGVGGQEAHLGQQARALGAVQLDAHERIGPAGGGGGVFCPYMRPTRLLAKV